MEKKRFTRRDFIKTQSLAGAALTLGVAAPTALASRLSTDTTQLVKHEPIIDIHQHTDYHRRTHEQLLAHQRAMGITTTILLPAGSPVISASTHNGVANGLQAQSSGNAVCYQFAQQHPTEFLFGANEVPDVPGATQEIEKYLKVGAKVIGEQKFGVECDAPEMQKIYQLAQQYNVPVLMHWQFEMYNYGLEQFHKMLEKFSDVNFIGHAQTWWANIDREHHDQTVLYPKGKVTPGGLTDRLLSEYPNVYGDLSAGSGLNALTRDEDHARGFLERHQDKLLYGSDCADAVGQGPECQGTQTIATIRRLSASKTIERKLLYGNAKKLFRLNRAK